MSLAKMKCPNRIDEDDDESAPCGDEGRVCDACFNKETAYWAGYFGLKSGVSPEVKAHNRAQLRAFAPLGHPILNEEE